MKRMFLLSFFIVFAMLMNAQTVLKDVTSELIKPNFCVGQTIEFNYSSDKSIRSTNGKAVNYELYDVLGSVTDGMSLQDVRKFLGSVVSYGNFTLKVKEATPYAYVMDLKIGEVHGYKVDGAREMNEVLEGMARFFRSAQFTLTFTPDMSTWIFTDSEELPSLFYDFNKQSGCTLLGTESEFRDKEKFLKMIREDNSGYNMLQAFFAVFCPGIFRLPVFYNNAFQRGHIEIGAPLSGKSKRERYILQDTNVDSSGGIVQKIKYCYYLDLSDSWSKMLDKLEKNQKDTARKDIDKYIEKLDAITMVSKDVYPVCVDISRKVDADGWITNYECSITVSKKNTSATFTERLCRK
ncbi:hypothetical protein J5A54_03615 [Prevotella melaninogenica]|uniref:hypothetical protein n=1 Tax=Prevotella melaninogenica TaxID=28132 RepID=UPI001BAC831E|nr:hypothetical protein [Prevotella melaninogenica]QUB63785.1 hypothetical protein J5A54_03615 [Prevotella melaninogenica]